MKFALALVLAVCVAGLTKAQTGSVHCGVGCACSEEADYVCGSDGVSYLNECKLRCHKCDYPELEFVYKGECKTIPYGYEHPHGHHPLGRLAGAPWVGGAPGYEYYYPGSVYEGRLAGGAYRPDFGYIPSVYPYHSAIHEGRLAGVPLSSGPIRSGYEYTPTGHHYPGSITEGRLGGFPVSAGPVRGGYDVTTAGSKYPSTIPAGRLASVPVSAGPVRVGYDLPTGGSKEGRLAASPVTVGAVPVPTGGRLNGMPVSGGHVRVGYDLPTAGSEEGRLVPVGAAPEYIPVPTEVLPNERAASFKV